MKSKEISSHSTAEFLLQLLPVGDTCEWWGTKWIDDPESKSGKKLAPCGEPTVGKGLFCDPTHSLCSVKDVCERHSYATERF